MLDAAFATQPELTVNLLQDPDCSDQPRRDTATLPLAGQPTGAICGYANRYALSEWAWKHDRAGTERMPCAVPDEAEECVADLTCSAVDSGGRYPNHKLCLAPCASDADCQQGELTRCLQGTCQLASPR